MISKISRSGHVEATKENSYTVTGQLPEELLQALFNLVESWTSEEEEKKKLIIEHATDEQALKWIDDFEFWGEGKDYKTDDRFKHYDESGVLRLYKARKDHKSQGHFPPSIHTASLYLMLVSPDEEGQVLPWENRWDMQKEGYLIGDRVIHKGFYWRSKFGEEDNWNYHEPSDEAHAAWEKEGEYTE